MSKARYCLALITFILVNDEISAQGTFQDAYNDFKQQAQANYEDFRQKANKEYAEWMHQAWEWHQEIAPMPRPRDEMLPPVIPIREEDCRRNTIISLL